MSVIGAWVVGVVMVALALGGLLLASHAHGGNFYTTGLPLFVFGFVFLLIKQVFDGDR